VKKNLQAAKDFVEAPNKEFERRERIANRHLDLYEWSLKLREKEMQLKHRGFAIKYMVQGIKHH
jgi:hypothetical protein